jgi:sugar lactone lactonase YvrE
VRFTAPSTPGTSTAVYTATSDDPADGHNRRITLTATTKAPVSVLHPGDIIAVDLDFSDGTTCCGGVVRVDPATGAQTLLSSGGSLVRPIGAAVEADGKLLIADIQAFSGAALGGQGGVIRVDPATGAQTAAASGGAFIHPMDVAVEADGSLLVADIQAVGGAGAIIRVAPATGAQSVVCSGGRPTALAVEADGKILFTAEADFDGGAGVIRVDPSSGATTQLSSRGSFRGPVGVAVEADGRILVADDQAFSDPGGGVIRVDPVSGAQTTVSSGGNFVRPHGIAVEAGGTILVADPAAFDGTGGVIRVDPVSGAQTVLSSGGVFKSPFGIAVVPTAGSSGGG